jgi:nitroreductase
MQTWDAITSRRNVRSFADRPIPVAELDQILEAGRNATSIVPASGSIATSSHPSRVAAGGGAARPAITSQNGPSGIVEPHSDGG